MISVITKKKYWLFTSGTLVIVSIGFILIVGLPLGIDFTGGSLLELRFSDERISHEDITRVYESILESSPLIQDTHNGVLIRSRTLSEDEHQNVIGALITDSTPNTEELRFESIGPSIGEELKTRSLRAMVFVLIAIVFYVAWAFRKVSRPVTSWKYGVIAITVLFHDVLIVVGLFILLSIVGKAEIDAPFIAAILTVLGYSVNDTIVIFDRIRENLHEPGRAFEDSIDISVNQSFTRSINTSITTLLVLFTILLFGGETIKSFVLALVFGVIVGTYSSLFIASSLLAMWQGGNKR